MADFSLADAILDDVPGQAGKQGNTNPAAPANNTPPATNPGWPSAPPGAPTQPSAPGGFPGGPPSGPGAPGQFPGSQGPFPSGPGAPGQYPGAPGQYPGAPSAPGFPPGPGIPGGQYLSGPGAPGQFPSGPGAPGQYPGQFPAGGAPGQLPGVPYPSGVPGAPPAPGWGQPAGGIYGPGGPGAFPPAAGPGAYQPFPGGAFPPIPAGSWGPPGGGFPPQPGHPGAYGPGPMAPFGGPAAPGGMLMVPYDLPLHAGIMPNLMITIVGEPVPGGDRFHIDFVKGQDVVFHFNPRFHEQTIVRNSNLDGCWGPEERDGGFPFVQGTRFELKILVEDDGFKVAVDENHLLEYEHRVEDFEDVTLVRVVGDVTLYSCAPSMI